MSVHSRQDMPLFESALCHKRTSVLDVNERALVVRDVPKNGREIDN